MKCLFIESKRKIHEDLQFDFDKLPERIGLLSTVQFLPVVGKVEDELKRIGKKVFKSKTLLNETQILGCNVSAAERIKGKVDAFLLLSSGKWHALMLSALGKPVFVYNGKTEKLSEEDIKKFNIRKKAALMNFLSQDNIGIIVSLKPGQFHFDEAIKLKKKLDKKGKKSFIFIADTLNFSDIENFDAKIFVNTACPGLFFDSDSIVNLKDLETVI